MKKKKQEKINLNSNQNQGDVIWMKGMDDIINLNSDQENENKKRNISKSNQKEDKHINRGIINIFQN